MKKTFKDLQKAISLINECNAEIANIQTLPYYKIQGSEAERQQDIAALRNRIENLEIEKLALINKMQSELEQMKYATHVTAA